MKVNFIQHYYFAGFNLRNNLVPESNSVSPIWWFRPFEPAPGADHWEPELAKFTSYTIASIVFIDWKY